MEKKYRNIPLYTDYEMKNALIDNSEELLNEIYWKTGIKWIRWYV